MRVCQGAEKGRRQAQFWAPAMLQKHQLLAVFSLSSVQSEALGGLVARPRQHSDADVVQASDLKHAAHPQWVRLGAVLSALLSLGAGGSPEGVWPGVRIWAG